MQIRDDAGSTKPALIGVGPSLSLRIARKEMPTTVVVDITGVIRWIDVHPNYTTRSEVPDILAAVDSVR